jgi:putative ABC transport system ATP-binding protein
LLAGLDKPTRLGRRSTAGARRPRRQGLTSCAATASGFVFQAFNLVPVLTAEENITLPLTLAGRKPTGVARPADRHRRPARPPDAPPAELSGGQQQRVAVARALVHRPAVLFADEPTGNLDSHSSEEVLGLLRQAVDEFGQTVIMVTHDAQAAAVADRIVVLRDGGSSTTAPARTPRACLDLMKAVA